MTQPKPTEATIFEQDGKVYAVLSHSMPLRDLAKETAKEIRYMAKIPRAKMRVVSVEEFKQMPFGRPSKEINEIEML